MLNYSIDACRLETEGLAPPNYMTKNGTRISADVHFVCIGKRVGSSWLQNSDLSESLDHDGRLRVDANLRVEGKSSIFVVGDITNTKVCLCIVYAKTINPKTLTHDSITDAQVGRVDESDST